QEHIQDGIYRCLVARPPAGKQKVSPYVTAFLQGKGRAQHEHGAGEHVGHVVGPNGGSVEYVSGHHLEHQRKHEWHNQPGTHAGHQCGGILQHIDNPLQRWRRPESLIHGCGLLWCRILKLTQCWALASARMNSDARSATMMMGALVLPDTSVGMMDASTTRKPWTPCTLSSWSTTAMASDRGPIFAVPEG